MFESNVINDTSALFQTCCKVTEIPAPHPKHPCTSRLFIFHLRFYSKLHMFKEEQSMVGEAAQPGVMRDQIAYHFYIRGGLKIWNGH